MTAIILAGGKNVRMGGRNKALLKMGDGGDDGVVVDDKTFIEYQIERLQRVFGEVIISARIPEVYSHLGLPIVTDIIPDKGPMGGIYSGLTRASGFYSFVIACDMPFVNVELIEFLKGQIVVEEEEGEGTPQPYDVVVPQSRRGLEPLHAFYSKNCIGPLREQIDSGALKMNEFLSRVKVRVVTLEEVGHIENIYNALKNLNTEEEYHSAMSSSEE